MKVFQCSRCKHLRDDVIEDRCFCEIGLNPSTKYRDKDDRRICLMTYDELNESKRWHKEFYWEK